MKTIQLRLYLKRLFERDDKYLSLPYIDINGEFESEQQAHDLYIGKKLIVFAYIEAIGRRDVTMKCVKVETLNIE